MNKDNGFHPQGGQGWNQPRPYYQGGIGNSNSFNPYQPTLRDLVHAQANINELIQKKLAANDKSLETIQTKMAGILRKSQQSCNRMSETQLAKLVAFVPSIEIGKILGQPKPTLQSVNVVTSIWAKPSCGSYFANYAEKLMCPRKNSWGELVGTMNEDPGTPMFSC